MKAKEGHYEDGESDEAKDARRPGEERTKGTEDLTSASPFLIIHFIPIFRCNKFHGFRSTIR